MSKNYHVNKIDDDDRRFAFIVGDPPSMLIKLENYHVNKIDGENNRRFTFIVGDLPSVTVRCLGTNALLKHLQNDIMCFYASLSSWFSWSVILRPKRAWNLKRLEPRSLESRLNCCTATVSSGLVREEKECKNYWESRKGKSRRRGILLPALTGTGIVEERERERERERTRVERVQ